MATEQRRVIWRHPKGIYETVEVSGTGVFGVPYCYRETVYTQDRDVLHRLVGSLVIRRLANYAIQRDQRTVDVITQNPSVRAIKFAFDLYSVNFNLNHAVAPSDFS